MKDRRRLLGLAVAAVLAVATWWIQGTGPDQPQEPAATSSVTLPQTVTQWPLPVSVAVSIVTVGTLLATCA